VSTTLADLQIATFAVDEIVEGTQTGWSDGRLTVSLPQLAVGAGEPALAEATVEVVRPGDPVRVTNVLDAVMPCVDVGSPAATFAGALGAPDTPAPDRLHRLDRCAVLSVCDLRAAGFAGPEEFPDAIVDMAGPGADRSPFGETPNVVVGFVPAPHASVEDVDRAIRRESLRVARELASATLDAAAGSVPSTATDVETFAWPPPSRDARLPTVVAIVQLASEGPLTDTFLRGEPLRDLTPTIVDPRILFAGDVTNGAYDWAAVRNVTAAYQRAALVRELFAAHGKRLRFAGVILTPGYLDTADEKRRAAEAAGDLAARLRAEGAICTTFSSGNSHTDTMLTVRACERRGIGTVALVCETNGGLTDHVPEADSLVSTGNEDDLVEAWSPERVVGAIANRTRDGEPVPTWAYLGACSEMGESTWTAVPA
jgi:glycine reductase complex component B subunit alpha and beta